MSNAHQETLLYCADDGALVQIAQKGCGDSSLEIFKAKPGHGKSRDNLNHSEIL